MISEETTHVQKSKRDDSHVLNVSVRGWICLMLIGTVCLMQLFPLVFLLVYNPRVTVQDLVQAVKIVEPLYSLSLMAAGFYLGQVSKPKSQTQ